MRALLLLALLAAGPACAADPILAPGGTLRAAYIVTNVAQGRRDPASGVVSGVIADISAELGRGAGVPVAILPLPTAGAVLDAVSSGAADLGFVAPNPARVGSVLFSEPYMLVQQTALVRADSPLRSVRDVDRAGQVIGVNTDDSVGVWLKGRLTAATLRETPDYTLREAGAWLQGGEVAAFAGGRQRLATGSAGLPNLRLLDDDFYGVPQAVAVPLDRPDRLLAVSATLARLRNSGALAESIARSGVVGLTVAPPAALMAGHSRPHAARSRRHSRCRSGVATAQDIRARLALNHPSASVRQRVPGAGDRPIPSDDRTEHRRRLLSLATGVRARRPAAGNVDRPPRSALLRPRWQTTR